MTSTEKELFQTQMLTRECVSSIYLFSMFWVSLHETILYNDKDPPWFNSRIKSLLQDKNEIFKTYRKNRTNLQLLNKLNFLQERLNGLITISKNNYYERMTNKLNNLHRNSKAYCKSKKLTAKQKLESIQYRACLAITDVIRGTSREMIYQEVGLESLQSRQWYRKLAMFYKIYKNKSPICLFDLIPEKTCWLYSSD